jgi:hypothetical protein
MVRSARGCEMAALQMPAREALQAGFDGEPGAVAELVPGSVDPKGAIAAKERRAPPVEGRIDAERPAKVLAGRRCDCQRPIRTTSGCTQTASSFTVCGGVPAKPIKRRTAARSESSFSDSRTNVAAWHGRRRNPVSR